jgi:hypothetical protein
MLNLIGEIDKRTLLRDNEADWSAVRELIMRELIARFLADQMLQIQASEQTKQMLSGSGTDLLGSACLWILRKCYPEYSTIITQSHWEDKLKSYILALQNQEIPLACKRGKEIWTVSGSDAAKVFGIAHMNLTGGAFTGLENLIVIKSKSRQEPKSIQEVQVDFRIHPLEEEIMNRIMAEKPLGKLKIAGKECWWIECEQLLPLLMSSGYHHEEILKIIDIAKSRGTFSTGEHKGKYVLYCKPLDMDQMKAQLQGKLEALKEEIEMMRQIPNYTISLDIEKVAGEIEELNDELHFEKLVTQINKAIEQNHARIPGYFDRLAETFKSLKEKVYKLKQSRQKSRLLIAQASSKWCADFNKYIVANLTTEENKIYANVDDLIQQIDKASMEYNSSSLTGAMLEKITVLIKGQSLTNNLEVEINEISNGLKVLLDHIRDYDEWVALLRKSDDLYNQLSELSKDTSHLERAADFMNKLDCIWDDISSHISTRNILGLGSYKQFKGNFAQLEEEHRAYLLQLRSAFDKQKDKVNQILQEINVESRVNEVFNPEDSKGSYERLSKQAAQLIEHSIESNRKEIEVQQRELVYTRDILNRLSEDQIHTLLDQIENCIQSLDDEKFKISVDWLQKCINEPEDEIIKLKNIIDQAHEILRDTKVIIRQSEIKEDDKIDPVALEMRNLIPPNEPVDLKQLILKMMENGRSSTEVLDLALESIVELFKKRKIQIRVELPRR